SSLAIRNGSSAESALGSVTPREDTMDAKDVEGIGRRNFLKYSGLALGASLTGLRPQPVFAAKQFGHSIVQQINHVKLYMTHYAFFEEPDPGVPGARRGAAARASLAHARASE